MKHLSLTILVATCVAGCVSNRQAEMGTAGSAAESLAGQGSAVSGGDLTFASAACQSGAAEVEIGKLAMANTRNPGVRALAREVARDHAKAEKELGRLFMRKGIPPEEQIRPEFESAVDRLVALRERDFDRAFKQQVIEDHERTIRLFEHQTEEGADPDLRAFANRYLPHLREHLAAARALDVDAAFTPAEMATGSLNPSLSNPATRITNIPR